DRHGPHLAAQGSDGVGPGGGDGDGDHVPVEVGGIRLEPGDVPGTVDDHGDVAGLELVDHVPLSPVDDGAGDDALAHEVGPVPGGADHALAVEVGLLSPVGPHEGQ